MLLITLPSFGQEIGCASRGIHSIKLLKSNNLFSFVYSDINSQPHDKEKSFNFHNKETVFKMIMDGFSSITDHQMIVLTTNDTIIKFEFRKIKGKKMLKIKQNNLQSKTFGTSTFFTKNEIVQLFGNP